MIKNERQYRITKAQAAKFEAALASLGTQKTGKGKKHPRLAKAEREALQSQLASLHEELREYEGLKAGEMPPPDLSYIAAIPRDLVRARIASGLTQKELAERLGMVEQQIQRYEATDYASVSFARIREIVTVLQPPPAGRK